MKQHVFYGSPRATQIQPNLYPYGYIFLTFKDFSIPTATVFAQNNRYRSIRTGIVERATGIEPAHASLATKRRTMRRPRKRLRRVNSEAVLVKVAGFEPASPEFQARSSRPLTYTLIIWYPAQELHPYARRHCVLSAACLLFHQRGIENWTLDRESNPAGRFCRPPPSRSAIE